MKLYIYPTSDAIYLKVSPHPKYSQVNYAHITDSGWLSVKEEIAKGIALGGGDFKEAPNWEECVAGEGKSGGTGYHSSAKFDAPDAAIDYLRGFFEIVDQR